MTEMVMDNKKKETIYTTMFMVSIAFLFCVFLLILSFFIEKTNDYESTTGYLINYDIDNSSGKSMYTLIYSYNVLDKKYTISSPTKVGILPKINSPRPIKYNPNNPSEATIPSLSDKFLFSFLGIFGIFVSTIIFIIEINKLITVGKLKTIFNLILRFLPGSFMIFVAYIITYIATGYFSFIKMFTYYTNSMFIPLLFAIIFVLASLISIITPTVNSLRMNN